MSNKSNKDILVKNLAYNLMMIHSNMAGTIQIIDKENSQNSKIKACNEGFSMTQVKFTECLKSMGLDIYDPSETPEHELSITLDNPAIPTETKDLAVRDFVEKLSPAYDNFTYATSALSKGCNEIRALIKRYPPMQTQLNTVLENIGVDVINIASGSLNTTFHEAKSKKETNAVAEGKIKEGHITRILRAGFMYKGDVLRVAQVETATAPAPVFTP